MVRNEFKNVFMSLFLCVVLLTNSGCFWLVLGAAGGAAGVAYAKGKLEKNVDYSVEDVHSAALEALSRIDVAVMNDELNVTDAKIEGFLDNNEKVIIDIESLTPKTSHLEIRVGTLGDKQVSQVILDAIEKQL